MFKSQFGRAVACAILVVGGFCPFLSQAQETGAGTAGENYSLTYPAPKDIFSPRMIGNPDAPNKVTLLLAPGFLADQMLFNYLYTQLLPEINEGKIKLEIILFGHNQMGLPAYQIAECVDPASIGDYLYLIFSNWDKIIGGSNEISKSLKLAALSNPEFMPLGMTTGQFNRRLDWCLMNRGEGIAASETLRFNAIYNYNFTHGGAVLAPVVIVNDKKIFEGSASMDDIKGAMQ